MAVKPEQLGRWLDADAVVYGEILNYEAYWAGLISVWRVTAQVRMVSTRDGHEIFTAQSHRYSVDLAPAIDPVDIGINSVQTLIDLRDLRLARAEYEVGREIVMRLPVATQNIKQLQNAAVQKERNSEEEGAVLAPPGRIQFPGRQLAIAAYYHCSEGVSKRQQLSSCTDIFCRWMADSDRDSQSAKRHLGRRTRS
jgi:hypothetical protein